MRNIGKYIATILLLLSFGERAFAAEYAVDINLCSYHIGRQNQGLNQWNPGIGVTYQFNEQSSISAGEYYNSYRFKTRYGMADHRPLVWRRFSAGVFAGFFTNYGKRRQGVFGGGLSFEYRPLKHLALDMRYVPPFSHGLGNVLGFSAKFPLP